MKNDDLLMGEEDVAKLVVTNSVITLSQASSPQNRVNIDNLNFNTKKCPKPVIDTKLLKGTGVDIQD